MSTPAQDDEYVSSPSKMAPKRRNGNRSPDASCFDESYDLQQPLFEKTGKRPSWSLWFLNNKKAVMTVAFFGVLGLLVMMSDPKALDLNNDSSPRKSVSAFKDTRYSKRSLTDYHDICVVGAGLSGSVIAERYASQRNQTSLIIERRDHIAGNCYDYIDRETNIRVSKYGAHLFHTYYERVWEYVQKFSDWTPYEHEVLALVDGKHVPVPVNIDTVNTLFGLSIENSQQMDEWLAKEQKKFPDGPKNSEEMAMSRVGERLYELIFHPYTIKQWAKEPRELGPEVTARIPVRNNHDPRYFADPHQALPTHGYTAIFDKMIKQNPLVTIKTNTDYFDVKDKLNCGKLYYTGPIDRYFSDLGWKKLEYRSLDFERKVVKDIGNKDFFQPKGVVNHPNATSNFTRIVEYKHFLGQTHSPHTVLYYEHSKDGGEPYYPVPNPENKELFQRYKDMAMKEKDVTFVGRLANYKYFNMDQTIENALALFDSDVGSFDVIVRYCDEDLAFVKAWVENLPINNTYVYSMCHQDKKAEDAIKGVENVQIMPANGGVYWKQHIGRGDIRLASQNLFVGCDTAMVDVQNFYQSWKEGQFTDYVKWPGKDSNRNMVLKPAAAEEENRFEFFVTFEAIKRYLAVHGTNLTPKK